MGVNKVKLFLKKPDNRISKEEKHEAEFATFI